MREFVHAQERLKRAILQQKQVNIQYEDARTQAEEAAIENEFMRVRKREHEEEKTAFREVLARFRRKLL